jgi:hypothetical protein
MSGAGAGGEPLRDSLGQFSTQQLAATVLLPS